MNVSGDAFNNWLSEFCLRESLPESFGGVVRNHYLPLARRLVDWRGEQSAPLAVAVNGAQGTGKSTLAACMAALCAQIGGLRTAVLSIDDLYLTKAEREQMGREVHPLFRTRGVPGTHDVALGRSVLAALLAGEAVALPSFVQRVLPIWVSPVLSPRTVNSLPFQA